MSDISLVNSKLKNLLRIIFNRRTCNSVSDLRRKLNLFLAIELHLYEVPKLLIKMLRDECVVSHVKSFLNDKEINRVNKRRKTTMCLDCGDQKNVTNRVRFKDRIMLKLHEKQKNQVLKLTRSLQTLNQM